MCALTGETVASAHRSTPASLRARIAERRVVQRRLAERLGVTEVHLSHVLVERIAADDAELDAIAKAIEDEASAPQEPAA